MSEELLINVSPMESRVAVLDNGVLGEIYIERHNKLGLVGNIYLGSVVRVLPGMQAAFIDIGQSRTAFLHVNDMQRLSKPPSSSNTVNSHDNAASSIKEVTKTEVTASGVSISDTQPASLNEAGSQSAGGQSDVIEENTIKKNVANTNMASLSHTETLTLLTELRQKTQTGVLSILPERQAVEAAEEALDTLDVTDSQMLLNRTPPVPVERKPVLPKESKQDLIQNRLHEGQRILVQVTKDQLGQ